MPLAITVKISALVMCFTNGFTSAGISLCPRKIVATAEHASMRLTPSSFASAAPRIVTIHFITPR